MKYSISPTQNGTIIINVNIDKTPSKEPLSEEDYFGIILKNLSGNPVENLQEAILSLKSPKICRKFFEAIIQSNSVSNALQSDFHLAWVTKGHDLRKALADDRLLARALRILLPPYNGPTLKLFRGEQAHRFEKKHIGFNWTPKQEVAECFARGLCTTYEGEGILLAVTAPVEDIICSPNNHSITLGEYEYVLDPFQLTDIQALKYFPKE